MAQLTTSQKQTALIKALTASCWYAACEDGHPFWSGPDETTYRQAQVDASSHDQGVHNDGQSHAVVLSC